MIENESHSERIKKLNEVLGKSLEYYRKNMEANCPEWIKIIKSLDRKGEISCESVAKFCFLFIILNNDLFERDEIKIVHSRGHILDHIFLVVDNKVVDPLQYKILVEYGCDYHSFRVHDSYDKTIKIKEVRL